MGFPLSISLGILIVFDVVASCFDCIRGSDSLRSGSPLLEFWFYSSAFIFLTTTLHLAFPEFLLGWLLGVDWIFSPLLGRQRAQLPRC